MSKIVSTADTDLSIARMTNESLRAELAKQLSLTAFSLMRAAAIWTELQRRGVDMGALRSGLSAYLPRIARGELAAEAVVMFAGQKTLLQNIAGMPLEDQRKYAAGEPVSMVERDEQGRIVKISKRLRELSGREVALALGGGRIRSLAEQRLSLRQIEEQPTRKRYSSGSIAKISARDGMIHVGRVRLDPLDLSPALSKLGFRIVRHDHGED